jgi:hypothetical protein
MADGVAIVVVIEGDAEKIGADFVEFAEKSGEASGAFVGGFRWDAVDFAAIAGGEDQGFFEDAAGAQFGGGATGLVGGEGDAFAHLYRSGAMV